MKTAIAILLSAAVLTAGTTGARADNADSAVGRYEVKYEEVTSNCQNTGMVLLRGVVDVSKRKASTVAIDIERIPLMVGAAAKGGRVKATSKLGPTSIQGLDGRFSIAGSINDDGVVSLVLVAEYYVKNKAYCTQSWNVTGLRAGGGGGGAETKGKKSATDTSPDAAIDVLPMHWMPPAE
jgi:hypothetical protein